LENTVTTSTVDIYIANIDTAYPKPGQDNNSQGFRDNFSNIQAALGGVQTHLNSLAATTLNVNAPYVTGTQVVSALNQLIIGGTNVVTTGTNPNDSSQFPTVIKANGRAGNIAFFPNINNIRINSISPTEGKFTAYNDPSSVLKGATFTVNNTVYTVTSVSGLTVNYTPVSPSFTAGAVDITNPTFSNFNVVTSGTINSSIANAFDNVVTLTAGVPATTSTDGTLVVDGGGGIGVSGDVVIGGVLSTYDRAMFNAGLDVPNTLSLLDPASIELPTTLSYNSFNASLAQNGYQKLPSGLILQWGLSDAGTSGEATNSVTFPTPFTVNCFNITTTLYNSSGNGNLDTKADIVSSNNTGFTFLQNGAYRSGYSAGQYYWFAIGV